MRRLVCLLAIAAGCGSSGTPAPGDGAPAPETDAAIPAADRGGDLVTVVQPDSGGGDRGTVPDLGAEVTAAAADALGTSPDAATGGSCTPCAAYGTPMAVGRVEDAQLDALSGIAASHRNPGVLYAHNDRARPEVYAMAESGAIVGRFTLNGGAVRDIEDIAVGPCPAGRCLYLADLGNNVTPRPDFVILRVPEPAVSAAGPPVSATLTAERLVFTYPDGAHNAESLLVDPRSGALYVITKTAAGQRSSAYRLPAFGAGGAAVKVADLPVPMAGDQPATAADAHPCGVGFILRTNNTAYEFRIPAGAPFEDAFRAAPMTVPAGPDVQSEGITYRPDGTGYYTNSEGACPPIHRVTCR